MIMPFPFFCFNITQRLIKKQPQKSRSGPGFGSCNSGKNTWW